MSCSYNFRMIFTLLFLTFASAKCESYFRNVTTVFLHPVDPQCINDTCFNLVHTSAYGPHDDLHYVYSTLGFPSVLVVRTTKDSKLSVDWDNFLSNDSSIQEGSLKMEGGSVLGSSLLSFDEIYLFNDPKDEAKLDDSLKMICVRTDELNWSLAKPVESNENLVQFISSMELPGNKTQTVTIEFLASSGNVASTTELPHLLLSNNLTEINIQIDNLNNSLNFSQPRVGLSLSMVASKNTFRPSYLVEEASLDDGLSPGAFRTQNWLSNENDTSSTKDDPVGAFVQWKPICYISLSRSIQNLTKVNSYDLKQTNSSRYMPLSVATGFYGHHGLDSEAWLSRLNVSFGITGDRFYSKTNFVTWQLTFGIGSLPEGSVSLLVILLIAIGLGVPVLVLIGGAIYLPIKARLTRRRGYEELLTSSYPRIA